MEILKDIILIGVPLKDWLTIVAILIAPLTALWIQGYLDDRKEANNRRLDIFKTLMATRASVLSPEHIKALNMIDTEFYGKKKYREVIKAWRAYLHARTKSQVNTEVEMIQFGKNCEDTLTDLLVAMGEVLGYDFDETHIKQSIYKPQGHVTEENYQMFMRTQLVRLFSGDISLPMDVKSLPITPDELQEQKKLRDLLIKYLERKFTKKQNGSSAEI